MCGVKQKAVAPLVSPTIYINKYFSVGLQYGKISWKTIPTAYVYLTWCLKLASADLSTARSNQIQCVHMSMTTKEACDHLYFRSQNCLECRYQLETWLILMMNADRTIALGYTSHEEGTQVQKEILTWLCVSVWASILTFRDCLLVT